MCTWRVSLSSSAPVGPEDLGPLVERQVGGHEDRAPLAHLTGRGSGCNILPSYVSLVGYAQKRELPCLSASTSSALCPTPLFSASSATIIAFLDVEVYYSAMRVYNISQHDMTHC